MWKSAHQTKKTPISRTIISTDRAIPTRISISNYTKRAEKSSKVPLIRQHCSQQDSLAKNELQSPQKLNEPIFRNFNKLTSIIHYTFTDTPP